MSKTRTLRSFCDLLSVDYEIVFAVASVLIWSILNSEFANRPCFKILLVVEVRRKRDNSFLHSFLVNTSAVSVFFVETIDQISSGVNRFV